MAAVDPDRLSLVVITHFHADHAYGLPSLVQGLRLLGRADPLRIACREEHVDRLQSLLAVFGLRDRPGVFPILIEPVAARPGATVAVTGSFAITAAPNAHGDMPN